MVLRLFLARLYECRERVTVQILCIGTNRSQQTVQTKIRLLLKKQSDQGLSTLFAIPSASFGCINAMLHQTFLFLGQLWQLFEVSQILEFLWYCTTPCFVIGISGDVCVSKMSKIFYEMGKALSGKLCCMETGLVSGFQSNQDNRKVIMKCWVQWNLVYGLGWKEFCRRPYSCTGPLDQCLP